MSSGSVLGRACCIAKGRNKEVSDDCNSRYQSITHDDSWPSHTSRYNVLLGTEVTSNEMVALTGYLYAFAGITSSLVNLFGTSLLLGQLGMLAAIMVTPTCLFASAVSVYLKPAVMTTLVGRSFELSLRWSINNTVKSVLWITVPAAQVRYVVFTTPASCPSSSISTLITPSSPTISSSIHLVRFTQP